jgi:hypothetical protein
MNVVADPHKLSVTVAALVLAAGYSTTSDYSEDMRVAEMAASHGMTQCRHTARKPLCVARMSS